MIDRPETFPVKPGDWVAQSGGRVARVKDVAWDGEYIVDLVIYDRDGTKVGRESPVMGGPRTFEPACALAGWYRIGAPDFPLSIRGQDAGNGRVVFDWDAGPRLPFREWHRPAKRGRASWTGRDELRIALETIAAGHNDARSLAQATLARVRR